MLELSRKKSLVHKGLLLLFYLLVLSYFFSLFASIYWVFDLFSHFLMQYMIGGIVLGTIFFFYYKSPEIAFIAFVLSFACFIEGRANLHDPFMFYPQKDEINDQFRIVQFNHHKNMKDFSNVKSWLKNETTLVDIIVLQEANGLTEDLGKELIEDYPFQINEAREHSFGNVVLSKFEILSKEVISIPSEYLFENMAVKMVVKTPGNHNLTIYILHAYPPVSAITMEERNFQLEYLSEMIHKDSSKNLIFIGDWNITPYSPYFKNILETTKLNYQSYGLFLNPSWPTQYSFPVFQIPIDHILYSDGLNLLNKEIEDGFGSDHYRVSATFVIHQ